MSKMSGWPFFTRRAGPFGHDVRVRARGPAAEHGLRCHARLVRHPQQHVVDDLPIAGKDLDRGHELVGLEAGRDHLLHELIGAVRADLDRVDLEDDVGRAERPLDFDDGRRLGSFAVTARRARRYPAHDGVDLGLVQAAVVLPRAVAGIGVPRRHHVVFDVSGDRLGPRPRLVVGPQRHRTDLVGRVAVHTTGVEDRRHVVVVGRGVEAEGRERYGENDRSAEDRRAKVHRISSLGRVGTYSTVIRRRGFGAPSRRARPRLRAPGDCR